MKKYRPSRVALNVIRIIMLIACVAVIFLSKAYLSDYLILMYSVIGIFCGLCFLFGMILLPIMFSKAEYNISVNDITKTAGFFLITKQYMRTKSIQYVTTITTPFSHFTSINFVIINALGGKIFLPFLTKKDVIEITATLNRAIRLNNESITTKGHDDDSEA